MIFRRRALGWAMRSLFGKGVIVAASDLESECAPFHPEEEAWIKNAAPRRRREFAVGRTCARRALARLGIEDYPLLPGPDRAPLWPPGVIGSISHTDGFCGVALMRQDGLTGIGLDIECAAPLDEQYWPQVLTPGEQQWLRHFDARAGGRLATLMFSAKECAYKCQYCVWWCQLEFSQVAVAIDLEHGAFVARLPTDVSQGGVQGYGVQRCGIDGCRVHGCRVHGRQIEECRVLERRFEERLVKGRFLFHRGLVLTGALTSCSDTS